MAPIFRMDFFEGVVKPTLWDAYTGWVRLLILSFLIYSPPSSHHRHHYIFQGLDFIWPFLLRYPRRHVAVIDDVCMVHSNAAGQSQGENNLYAVPVPYNEREEESRRLAEFGYWPSRVEAMGIPYRGMETFGGVERTIYKPEDLPPGSYAAGPDGSFSFIGGTSFGRKDILRDTIDARREVHVFLGFAAVMLVALVLAMVARGKQGRQGKRSPKHHMAGLA